MGRNAALTLILLLTCMVSTLHTPALALIKLSDSTINDAIAFGLENQDTGLSTFLGGNWREGSDGTLINIYTPYMEIARSAVHRDLPDQATAKTIADARKKMVEDIHYIYHHPTVKFNISMVGNDPTFSRKYYAKIEGVGKGRQYVLLPAKSHRQQVAVKEEGIEVNPYTAINTYHFKYDDIAKLDEFVLKLYGDDVEVQQFKINNSEIR